MVANAIVKLKAEIEKSKTNPYIQTVGNFLLGHLENHPQDAEKIMPADKTITGSLKEMRKEASRKKVGDCAILTDQEAFSIVLKYFGIKTAAEIPVPAEYSTPHETTTPEVTATTSKQKSKINFEVNLDDLL